MNDRCPTLNQAQDPVDLGASEPVQRVGKQETIIACPTISCVGEKSKSV